MKFGFTFIGAILATLAATTLGCAHLNDDCTYEGDGLACECNSGDLVSCHVLAWERS